MAHRQKYLAGEHHALSLEEAYWRVMSKITEVDDFTYTCNKAGFTTSHQRREADNLRHILVDQNTCLHTVWQNEADVEKLYNTRELMEIINEEVITKLADMKDAIISLPGSAPRPRPPPRPLPRSPTRQQRRDIPENYHTGGYSSADKIRRTTVYTDHNRTYEHQQYEYPVKVKSAHHRDTPPYPPNTDRIAQKRKDANTHHSRHDEAKPSRKRNLQTTDDTEPGTKIRRTGNHNDGQRTTPGLMQMPPTNKKNTAGTDAMIPPDVKPDIKPDILPDIKPDIKPRKENSDRTSTKEESFAARVARRSKQILIDDYQSAKAKGETTLAAVPDSTFSNLREKPSVGRTKNSKSTANITSNSVELTSETKKRGGGPTPDKAAQMVDADNVEHRKRKHNVGTNRHLVQWLWGDPKRIPKVREDIAKWSKYMANEMSNPAFEIFINMATNLRDNKTHSTRTQDD